ESYTLKPPWEITLYLIRSQCSPPPQTRRPYGCPKDKRVASTEEIQPPKKKKLIPHKCGRCGRTGHNRTNCIVPI
ncbi:hypothetical protein HID58_042235, partial [Brassica napus]